MLKIIISCAQQQGRGAQLQRTRQLQAVSGCPPTSYPPHLNTRPQQALCFQASFPMSSSLVPKWWLSSIQRYIIYCHLAHFPDSGKHPLSCRQSLTARLACQVSELDENSNDLGRVYSPDHPSIQYLTPPDLVLGLGLSGQEYLLHNQVWISTYLNCQGRKPCTHL